MGCCIVRLIVLSLFTLLFLSGHALALSRDPLSLELPEVEIIPGADWYWVGQRMALNGVPMSVKMFSYRGRLDDVVQFYLGLLKSKGHGKLTQSKLREQVVLGYQLGEFYYSIQVSSTASGVEGKAVVTPSMLNIQSSTKTELPLPPRSTTFSKVESMDGGRRAETVSAESRMDVGYVVDFYKDQLGYDGWKLFSQSGDLENSAVLSFQRGVELLQLTATGLQVNNSKKCQFLLNWVK